MCDQSDESRKGWVKVAMTPADKILALVDRLDAAQRTHLEVRIMNRPGFLRSCFTVWAWRHRDELARELPQDVHALMGRIWRTIDAICHRHDRSPKTLPKCCREGERRAKLALARKKKR